MTVALTLRVGQVDFFHFKEFEFIVSYYSSRSLLLHQDGIINSIDMAKITDIGPEQVGR
jgi:hypothetical protein